ncbi:hypothetical protein ABFX02_04G098700 [Erythranthe guttata]
MNGKMKLELLKMVVREKGEIPMKPVIMKVGLAIAISLGGILYTYSRTRRIKPSKSKPSQRYFGNGREANSRRQCGNDLKDLPLRKVSSRNSMSEPSSTSGRHSGDHRDGFLLPEFDELLKECITTVKTDDVSQSNKTGDHEIDINKLSKKIEILEERERKLEIQLLEYYGIKEQESAVFELQNRLRLNNMEAKIYSLKIESLLSDNRRLEMKVADYAQVVNELEIAKSKIKMLRKKLKSEGEQNREQILSLQDRVMKLQDQEKKAADFDREVEMQLKEMNELKAELDEMKKSNGGLKLENSDLAQKLEYVKMLAASALDNEEMVELKEESRRLKQQNEDLTKEIERLQSNRSTEVEEIVYLRWINACLRHELKNHHPGAPPKAAPPKDLSKTLSPKSEEKLHKEAAAAAAAGFDSDRCSSSQASCLTDSGDVEDPCAETDPTVEKPRPSKSKVFAKLRRLLRGKGIIGPRRDRGPSTPLERAASVDNFSAIYSSDFINGSETLRNSSNGSSSSRRSFDVQRSYKSSNCSTRMSDDGSSSVLRRIDSLTEDEHRDWSPGVRPDLLLRGDQDAKNELMKYAESFRERSALYGSR